MQSVRDISVRIVRFYVDGFRRMTIGRTLWAIIIVKLVVFFAVLKLFFFPTSSPPATTATTPAPRLCARR